MEGDEDNGANEWWKCKDEIMVEYRERVMRKYEELHAEMGIVEGE